MSKEVMKLALEALENGEYYIDDLEAIVYAADDLGTHEDRAKMQEAITALREALAEQPAQQEPVAKVCHDLDGHIGWNPNLRQLPDEGTALYAAPPAQRPHECSRSHPHENMDAMCELRTEIARLTNENARLKALHQDDEINTYRMTLLCIRDGLQQGMSKSIQKLQAREINDVMGLPSFASYRTSPPAQPNITAASIYEAIKHGDERHREWLKTALENVFAGLPVKAEQPAQRQEPDLAKLFRTELDKLSQRNYELRMENASLKASPPAQQEPVAWYRDEDGIRMYYESKVWDDATSLYTSPAQRKPLTLDELWRVFTRSGLSQFHQRDSVVEYKYQKCIEEFARAIEAAHNIKEQP